MQKSGPVSDHQNAAQNGHQFGVQWSRFSGQKMMFNRGLVAGIGSIIAGLRGMAVDEFSARKDSRGQESAFIES